MFIKKKLLRKVDEMTNIKNENSKTQPEEAIDTLINCFQSRECIWNMYDGAFFQKH